MKIAVIGAGAMGSIYGGHLSLHHDVYLVDTNDSIVSKINQTGLVLQEDGNDVTYWPKALISTEETGTVDLVILFVKAFISKVALEANRSIIGDNTYIMALQNGSGHEEILSEFVDEDRIIIGTTEDNGAVLAPAYVRHGGTGKTNIGMLVEDKNQMLPVIKEAFDSCGFVVEIHEHIQQLVWDKLFVNTSLSALTGVLQVPMGYIATNPHAWNMACQLIHESVMIAKELGIAAEETEIQNKVKAVSLGSPEGVTSICADLKGGRKTEVDTISGAVVRAAEKTGIPAPSHRMLVEMVHAMEGKS